MSTIETESAPFAGGGLTWHEPTAMEDLVAANFRLTSPFAGGFTGEEESESAFSDVEALIGELEDEGFHEAVESLVDEVAGRHLEAMSRWPDAQEAENAAAAEASAWMESFADAVDSKLAELEARYDTRRVDSFSDREADTLLAEFARDPDSASEQFLGGLVKKAVNVAKSVAKGAVSGLTRLIPMGPVFGRAPQARRAVAQASAREGHQPAARPAARTGDAARHEVRSRRAARPTRPKTSPRSSTPSSRTLLLAPSDAAATELLFEVEQDSVPSREDPIAALDRARATLARQLAEAEPGRPPTEQLEQFIPAVMAAMPLIRTGVKIVGRDRIKSFLAGQLATMIQGYVGPQAARALAPHIADTGLRLLSLEAESSEQLGAEALVSTLEEAITQVMAMPAESLDDPLRLEAEVQEALACRRGAPPAPGTAARRPRRATTPRAAPVRGWRCPAPGAHVATASRCGASTWPSPGSAGEQRRASRRRHARGAAPRRGRELVARHGRGAAVRDRWSARTSATWQPARARMSRSPSSRS